MINYNTFKEKLMGLEKEVEEKGYDPADVDVIITRTNYEMLLWVMKDDLIISYFKW